MTKISSLSDIGTGVASNDTFVLVDASDPTTPNKKIQQQNLFLIPDGSQGTPALRFLNDTDVGLYRPTTNALGLVTGGSEQLRIDSSGRVGIGTTSPGNTLHVAGTARIANSAGGELQLEDTDEADGNRPFQRIVSDSGSLVFLNANRSGTGTTSSAERARIDSSGRLLIGTSSAGASRNIYGGMELEASQAGNNAWAHLTQYGNSYTNRGARLYLNFTLGTSAGSATAVTTEDELGAIHFRGANGTTFQSAAEIRGETDTGTISGTSMPGRLVFSSTPSGSASPVERLRITSAGVLQIADAGNIAVGTTTGTKIGTATTQKLGFFNKTPVAQPTAVADATDAASVITQLNALLARMRDLGLIAT